MIKKLYILILSMIIIVSCSKNNPNNPNNGENGDGGTTPTENKYDTLFLKFKTDKDTVSDMQKALKVLGYKTKAKEHKGEMYLVPEKERKKNKSRHQER